MALVLQIDTDENYDFFVLYDNLSPLRQKIWQKVADLCRSWTTVIPSQSKIALWCNCSRSAISEAFRLFQDYGWMSLASRGWKKSKSIFVQHSKQQIDVVNRNYFKEVRATYKATHISSTYRKTTGREGAGLIAIRQKLQKKEIPLEVQLKLSMISEAIFEEALYQCKKKAQKGVKFDNEYRYLCGVALGIAVKRGEKLNWRDYYYTIDVIRKNKAA